MQPPPPAADCPWDLDAARAFWYGLINYEQQPPRPDDLRLDRMRQLLARLGNPHRCLRIVHVAGSKGKGSTSAFLAAIFQRAGYRTGLFTSPHLVGDEERIQIDGVPISAAELTQILHDIHHAVASFPALTPTFFEVATAAGFLHFARRRAQAAVVEVGLGGRLDSTNVCRPRVAVITSISFDHMRQLGPTLARIAREKAGIVKRRIPTVSGATVPEAAEVIEAICRERGSPLWALTRELHYDYEPGEVAPEGDRPPLVRITTPLRTWPALELGLLGEHQAANAAVAVACVELLRREGWHLPDEAVAAGVRNVVWPARLEVVRREPLILLDCAHNVASARALVETLRTSFMLWPREKRSLLFAGSSDKDLAGMLTHFAPHFAHVFLTRYTHNPRAVPPENLVPHLVHPGLSTSLHATPADTLAAALGRLGPDELLCITGSVFLAGEMRPLLVPPVVPVEVETEQ
jgi:dihydrofolate synthase/folylpolyglutamate synthase